MATHSRIPAWGIPWTEEPGELQFMGLQRVESYTTEQLTRVLYKLAPAYLTVISHNLSAHDTCITQPCFYSLAPGSRSLHLPSLRSIHLDHSASPSPPAAFAPRHSGLPLSTTSESLWPLT